MDNEFFRRHVTGPVVSINTPFLRNGDIDFAGLAAFIDFALDAGTKAILFTPGDSLYDVLNDQEIAELTKFTARHIAKRAMFIAAGNRWWTAKAVEFAQYAREVEADATIAVPPARGAVVRDLVDYYQAVSQHLPVFILSGSLSAVGVEPALETVKILLDQAPNVVGLKEDYGPEFARRACLLAHEKWAIFAGGQKQTHMDMLPYGCDGYMSIFMLLKPEISHTYWDAIERNDLKKATAVIRDYDMPVFQFLYSTFPAGGDAAQHGMLELRGICGRWRRKPLPDLTDADTEKLKTFLQAKSLL